MAKRLGNDGSVGDILRQIIGGNNLQHGIDDVDVRDAWKELMGNGVNSYTRNIALKKNILYVELTSAVLREELHYGKDKIIRMINERLGRDAVNDVVLR